MGTRSAPAAGWPAVGAARGDLPGAAARRTGRRGRARGWHDAASRTAPRVGDHRTTSRAIRRRRAIAVGTFGSSIPLAIYAATASARLRQLGITAPGATIALAGGLLASPGLALSSLTAWTLSRPEVTSDAALVRALYYLVYLTGGPWHVVTSAC